MAIVELFGSAAAGWAIGKTIDTVFAPLNSLAADIDFRLEMTSALERVGKRLPEAFSEDEQRILSQVLRDRNAVLFTTILERLRQPIALPSLHGGLSGELSQVLKASGADAGPLFDKLADLIDEELWRKPPLRDHRQVLSDFIQEQRLSHLLEQCAPNMSAAAVAARVRLAGREDIEKRLASIHKDGPILPRRISATADKDANPEQLGDLAERVKPNWRAALIDQGGAGKSTSLLWVARSIMQRSPDRAAAFLPMSNVARINSVFDALLQRQTYIAEKVTRADLAAQAQTGRLVLAFDGWNELRVEERDAARKTIKAYHEDYPEAPILFASRPSWAPLPVTVDATYRLDRIGREAQAHFIHEVSGPLGVEALAQAHQQRELGELLGIPFFLRLFAILPWQDGETDVPRNRTQLVSSFVDTEFTRPIYDDPPPDGTAEFVRQILTTLAVSMVNAGSVEISLEEASRLVSKRLQHAGLAFSRADINRVIQRVAQQSMVHLIEAETGSLLTFDHQLLRDWFAASHVQSAIETCFQDPGQLSQASQTIGDQRNWQGATSIAVEQLGSVDPMEPGLRRFLFEMCGIDAGFAASLLDLLSDGAWAEIASQIEGFVDAWRVTGERSEVFSFMIRTGRSCFADRIFEDLSEKDDGTHERELRQQDRFDPSVLGNNWKARAIELDRNRVRMLVHDLAYFGGNRGLIMAIDLAATDVETDHLGFVLDEIDYQGLKDEAEHLLNAMDDAALQRWLLDSRFQKIAKTAAPERYRVALESAIMENEDPGYVLRAKMALCALDNQSISEDLIRSGLEHDEGDKENRHWFLNRFVELAPDLLSQVVLSNLKTGDVAYKPERYITARDDGDRAAILAFLMDETREEFSGEGLAILLETAQVRRVLTAWFALQDQMAGISRDQAAPLRKRYRSLKTVLQKTNAEAMARILINTPVNSAAHASLLLNLIMSWEGENGFDEDGYDDRGLKVSGLIQSALIVTVQRWCRLILEAPNRSREWLCLGIQVLAQIGRPSCVPLMRELLEAELDQHAKEQAEFLALPPRQRRHSPARMSWGNLIRQAFAKRHWPEAANALLAYIGDERFENDAAIAIRTFAPYRTADVQNTGQWRHRITHDLRQRRRVANAERPVSAECHPIAAQILDRIKEIEPETEALKFRRRSLAASAAWMDCGPRLNEVIELIQTDPEPRHCEDILEGLMLTGHPIKADWVLPGLTAAEAVYFERDWRSDNDFYILRTWLELLAQSDRPLELIDRLKDYPREIIRWRVRDYIPMIMLEDPDEMIDAIEALHAVGENGDGDHERVRALFRIGTDRAHNMLLEDYLAGRYSGSLHFGFQQPNALADMLESNPDHLIELVERDLSADEKETMTSKLRNLLHGTHGDALFNLAVERAAGEYGNTWRALLAGMLEAQCVLQEPLGQGSYELHQKSVAILREQLFARARNEPEDEFWKSQLKRIDRIVASYGGHPEDPRHPDITSKKPYPGEANLLWQGERPARAS